MRVAAIATSVLLAAAAAAGSPSFDERVEAQRRIDAVYLSHQIGPPRSVADALPRTVLERTVRTYLQQSRLLERRWNRPITRKMLERELQRMVRSTRMPSRLRELFRALDDDPALIAECLARPALADRLARAHFALDRRAGKERRTWDEWWPDVAAAIDVDAFAPHDGPVGRIPFLEELDAPPCLPDDTWDNGSLDLPDARVGHTAVWTGSEMIVWGGVKQFGDADRGARYDPATDTWALVSTLDAPAPRENHTAVWTGSEMIVWGGGPSATNTGGRYDPQTDSWTPTTTDGAPDARYQHTAVWDGSKMIVWGGIGGGADGGRYDPSTDTWQAVSRVAAPEPRGRATAVWTGDRMIVWGGTWAGTELDSGGVYDPATDAWTPTTTSFAPSARHHHTAVWTGELMVVWGGNTAGSPHTDTGAMYEPDSDVWFATPMALAPDARERHTAVWTGSVMIVWGGTGNSGTLDDGGTYNPQSNAWGGVGILDPPSPRAGHTAVWTGSEMLVWGGGPAFQPLDTGARYDPVTGWTPMLLGGVPEGRTGHTTVWTGNRMIVWGGWPLAPGARYDPTTDHWMPTSTVGEPEQRENHTAVWTGGEMIVWGGTCCAGKGSFDTGGRYDPLTDSWQATTTVGAPSPRWGHSAIGTSSEMIVWGGAGSFGPKVDDGARYRPATDSWTATSTVGAPEARTDHTAVWTGNRMIVWGGETTQSVKTGGVYDPVFDAWNPTAVTGAPSGRSRHTALWTGDEMIVWGGSEDFADELDSGGRFDPQSNGWQATSTLGAPGPRMEHTAVWTGSRMIVWGGFGELPVNCCLDDGAVYDPDSDVWDALAIDGAPSARMQHGSVWTGSFMVVWGGLGQLRSGGRYALGHAVDDDGDGLSECGGDCADADAGVFGPPQPIEGLTISQTIFVDALLQWQSDAPNSGGGTRYDVLRGTLSGLTDFDAATCLYDGVGATVAGDAATPVSGDGFYYLVRGQNVCATGSWGENAAGVERTSAACP